MSSTSAQVFVLDETQAPASYKDTVRALREQREQGFLRVLEPRTICGEHGPQNGPGCPSCWEKYGPSGRPLTDEEKAGRPASVDDLRAELAEVRRQLAESNAAAQEFAAWKAEQVAAAQAAQASQEPQQ